MRYLILMLVSLSAHADQICHANAIVNFDNGLNVVSVEISDCTVVTETLLPPFTINPGTLVTMNWDAPATRVNGDPLPLREIDRYEIEVNGVVVIDDLPREATGVVLTLGKAGSPSPSE